MKGLDVYEWLIDNVFVWFAVAALIVLMTIPFILIGMGIHHLITT
jgi:hypothetical protein